MKKIECTFYRPDQVNVRKFQEITDKLESDVALICRDEVSGQDILSYAKTLIALAKPLKKNPKMYFLGLDEPGKMPSDARVDFFYKPTYFGTAVVMKAAMAYPDLLREHDSVIHGLLLGCTGRGFKGHGFDDLKGLIETLRIFAEADCEGFLSKNPEACVEFTGLYRESMEMLEKLLKAGKMCNEWGEDYTEAAIEVLNLYRINACW